MTRRLSFCFASACFCCWADGLTSDICGPLWQFPTSLRAVRNPRHRVGPAIEGQCCQKVQGLCTRSVLICPASFPAITIAKNPRPFGGVSTKGTERFCIGAVFRPLPGTFTFDPAGAISSRAGPVF
ncbi:hypothetical protein QBC36DRAFT_318395 [Triangularia setosa]|uniref:Secreted protein n=1 Tax=Triangularia setosa TaxID=2587417 RepID=A0AAN7ACY4_9PEZI|nr:hypothetical protein QBC36DRAFT_318395 [Podospora setosa]